MNESRLKDILESIRSGSLSIDTGISILKNLPYEDIGYAKIDHHRELRIGLPEVIYCKGKRDEQIINIAKTFLQKQSNILATKINKRTAKKLSKLDPRFTYHEIAQMCTLELYTIKKSAAMTLIISAGTADLPVVEEAFVTADILGNTVSKLIDVGVAGIHRLLDKRELLTKASVIIVVAGMEGALASVVGGLVDKPVIAVPTSIGYGANFGGLSALLAMLNSCSPTVLTVNIDNGFGAAYAASIICKNIG